MQDWLNTTRAKMRAFFPLASGQFSLLVASVLILFYNIKLFSTLIQLTDFSHLRGPLFIANFACLLWLLTFTLISLFNFPRLGKIIAGLLIIIAAMVAYFMDAYGILIHRLMIQNLVETDVREVRSLLNMHLVFYLVGLGIIPALLLARAPVSYKKWTAEVWQKTKHIGITLVAALVLVVSMSADYASFFRNHKEVRQMANPLNAIYAGASFLVGTDRIPDVKPFGEDAHLNNQAKGQEKPTLFILVVGETARADHFGLNGYQRDTTPLLAKQELINFSDVTSCGTETAVSVPCMFSGLGRKDYSDRKAKSRESLLDVINRAGVHVLWRDNNSSCKGTCNRVSYEDMQHLQVPELCNSRECFDEILLHQLDEKVAANNGNQLIVLHQKGSHGPDYFNRYPQDREIFQPACKTNQLQQCSQQEVINGFDNTIRYTDFFLNSTIEWLKTKQQSYHTALVYLSDHGESLGEKGMYLHGLPYSLAPDAQKQVPLFMWLPQDFAQTNKLDTHCLVQLTNHSYSQDNLFHTLLGLLNIDTSVYDEKLDITRGCRTSALVKN